MKLRLLLSLFLSSSVIQAVEPSTAPLLRIEAGMHTASIRCVSSDSTGRLVLTVSDDKTARLWELEPQTKNSLSATLLRTFRIPIGDGNEGKLFAGAITPDGTTVAVAGFTGAHGQKKSIYLIDTATGIILRQINGLPNVIKQLAFSPNGRELATVVSGAGLLIFDNSERPQVVDTGYGGDSYGLEWQSDSLLATTSLDGKLRLYVRDTTRLQPQGRPNEPRTGAGSPWKLAGATTLRQWGKQPFSARFATDGSRLAVGFFDRPSVVVLVPGKNATIAPDTKGITNGNLNCVAWSADSQTLVAGGTWQDASGARPIRIWDEGGSGPFRDVKAAQNTIFDLRTLPFAGRNCILYAAGDPSWGIVDLGTKNSNPRSDKVTILGHSPIADFHDNHAGFRISRDATEVTFGFQQWGKNPASFSVAGRKLALGQPARPSPGNTPKAAAGDTTLHSPLLDGIDITGWKETFAPKLQGRLLKLEPSELSRSLAIARDISFFLLGTEWRLRCYAADGTERWHIPTPGAAWAVNVSDDGRIAVAAYSDGTIRWYAADSGKELLSLFPHANRKHWLLWTPEGYFDCSPGAEDLSGWQFNRGQVQAGDFFPASRFRAIYYRPDVIQQVLKTRNVSEALRQANTALGRADDRPDRIADIITSLSPPVVELGTGGIYRKVVLPSGAGEIKLSYRVRQSSRQPTTKVEIRANGRPLPVEAPVPPQDKEVSVTVPLPAWFEGEISVIASHALGRSEAETVRIRRSSPPVARRTPKMYVISVGAAKLAMNQGALLAANQAPGKTKDRFENLEFAADDATKVAESMAAQQGKTFERVETAVLLNEQATTSALRTAIQTVTAKAEFGDVLFFFFSGHGNHDPATGKFHLVTHDTDPKREAETAFSGEELGALLGQVRGYVVVALDACHSGAVLGMQLGENYKAPPLDISGLANQLSSAEHGLVVFSSSTPDQVSFEDRELGGGIFTRALLEGLSGKAATDGKVTCFSLTKWVDERVPQIARDGTDPATAGTGPDQTPITVMPAGMPDFVLARP